MIRLDRSRLQLWVAQGFGVGRVRVAPGTFGSALGLAWFALLLAAQDFRLVLAGCVAGFALSVWLCGAAEKILRQTDPASVVLDEVTAMPACFLAWLGILMWREGAIPGPLFFCSGKVWPLTVCVFAAFRFFDVIKPWPVRQSQRLPGGWGVTVDDFLAAAYVNLVVALVFAATNTWMGLARLPLFGVG